MFIVQPFEKGGSIRSALGFMSITSRWADVLFPGITVLTRDLNDIKAMHEVYINEIKGKRNLKEFISKDNDIRISKQLARNLGKPTSEAKNYRQVMSYWQRYGSLFRYYNLFDTSKTLSINGYRKLIFDDGYSPKSGMPFEKDRNFRNIRIKHSNWYRENFDKFARDVSFEKLSGILSDKFQHWWLTGIDAPRGIPKLIDLSRRLEFLFVVWQTTFEAAALLVKAGEKVPKCPQRSNPIDIEVFFQSIIGAKNKDQPIDDLQEIVLRGLSIHRKYLGTIAVKWEKEAKEAILNEKAPSKYHNRLFYTHNEIKLSQLAQLSPNELLQALCHLHVKYCHLQGKPNAIYIRDFHARQTGHKFPELSASLNSTRWGLFGYRYDASIVLYWSKKYEG